MDSVPKGSGNAEASKPIVADSETILAYNKEKPQKYLVWSQSKWSEIKEDVTSFTKHLLTTYGDCSLNQN